MAEETRRTFVKEIGVLLRWPVLELEPVRRGGRKGHSARFRENLSAVLTAT